MRKLHVISQVIENNAIKKREDYLKEQREEEAKWARGKNNESIDSFSRPNRNLSQTPNMFTVGKYKNRVSITSSPAVDKYLKGISNTKMAFYNKTSKQSPSNFQSETKKNSLIATTPGMFF